MVVSPLGKKGEKQIGKIIINKHSWIKKKKKTNRDQHTYTKQVNIQVIQFGGKTFW